MYTEKNSWFWLLFFVGDVVNGLGFWFRLPGPRPKPLDGSISLELLLGTWLDSKSFEPLIDFLGSGFKSYGLQTTK